MVTKNNTYSLREIVNEMELPFLITKPNYTSDFYCRADAVEGDKVVCTGIKGGQEYNERKYSYSLDDEVIFLIGKRKTNAPEKNNTIVNFPPENAPESSVESEPIIEEQPKRVEAPAKRKTVLPVLYSFFSNPLVMNGSYYELLTGDQYNLTWIQALAVNYLALIRRKIRVLFKNDDFDLDQLDQFIEYFPAYENCEVDEDALSSLSLFLNDLFDFSLTKDADIKLTLTEEILPVLQLHKCEITLFGQHFIPAVEKAGEITTFGVFALINTFLDESERNSLAFDLLNESSGRSHYYLEELLQKSQAAKGLAQDKQQEIEEKEKTILSIYIHRKLTMFYLSNGDSKAKELIREYVESALFIGDSSGYTLADIALSLKDLDSSSGAIQTLIEELFAIAINRKYYNLIKWREMDNKGSFLKNAEKFCTKLSAISDCLVTAEDEKILYEITHLQELRPINEEQRVEMNKKCGTEAFPLDKIYIQMYHVSDDINDVLYDNQLLGSWYKWFFTFEQDEENIVPKPYENFAFIGWDSKVVGDSPISKVTLFNDVCDMIRSPADMPGDVLEFSGTFAALVNEQDEEFDEAAAEKFYEGLECSERTPEVCRTVFYTAKFAKSLQSLEGDIADKVRLIINKFAYLPDRDLKAYLNSQNSKHLQGAGANEIPFYKFRLSRAARLFFCYGSDLQIRDEQYPDGSIVLSEVVTDHDEQDRAGSTVINRVFRFEEFIRKETGVELNKKTLLYEASTMLPLLSDEQTECSRVSLPCEIMGSAGSGKSSIAVEMYRKKAAEDPSLRILYVANSPALVKHIRECLLKAGIANPICMTFGELSLNDYHSRKVVQKDTFAKYVNSLYEKNRYSKVPHDVFSMCFDSGIKGNLQLAKKQDRLVSKQTFLRETAKKENIDDDLADSIYELAGKYDAYLKENDILDNNDLAKKLLIKANNPSFQKFDIILADEIQDMTGLQVQALLRCCKNFNICFLGDKNQVIVPSTFDFGELERGIYGQLDGKVAVQRVLKKTYRCGAQLIHYLNGLNALRRERIGAGSQEDDALEESMRGDADSSMIAVLVTNPDVCEKFIQKAKETAQCSIIVDNEKTKSLLSAGQEAPNIITVEDAKGLEYNIVVLYNFVKDNYDRFKEIFDGSGTAKRSTLHRIVFNKYYVSCTRAIDRIIICDSSEYAQEFKDTLFAGLDEKNNLRELNSYLNPSAEAWLSEAIRLYDLGRYQNAQDYLQKYASLNLKQLDDDYEKYKDLCEYQLLLQESTAEDDWRHCAKKFEQYEDYSSARYVYDSYLKDRYNVFRIDLKTNNLENYLNNPQEMSSIIAEANISDEDAKTIVNSLFIKKQLSHAIAKSNKILEELIDGE